MNFRNGSNRLCDIVTGDETRIYHQQIGHKSTNAGWVTEGESPIIVVRRGRFGLKTLFSIFFKSNGPVLTHAIDKYHTVNHNYYIENCLKPVAKEIRKRSRQLQRASNFFLTTLDPILIKMSSIILTKEGIVIMSYSPYSLDFGPCNY